MTEVLKVYLAAPRGFCAGVERAIETVKLSLSRYGKPVYVLHEIVHNKHVIDELKQAGAVFIEHTFPAETTINVYNGTRYGVTENAETEIAYTRKLPRL